MKKIETEEDCFYLGAESNSEREKWMGHIGTNFMMKAV